MWQMNLILFTQGLLILAIIVLIYHLERMKAQVDEVTQEVRKYISFILEEEENTKEKVPKNQEKKEKISIDEANNSWIQSVLGDFFS